MKHGDKAKAKAVKSSQASAAKKSSSKGSLSAKGGSQESRAAKASNGSKAGKGQQHGSPAAKGGGSKGAGQSAASRKATVAIKGRPPAAEVPAGFSNPAVSAAFHRVLQKYPNALRKLTD